MGFRLPNLIVWVEAPNRRDAFQKKIKKTIVYFFFTTITHGVPIKKYIFKV